jgi:hypothetical protein
MQADGGAKKEAEALLCSALDAGTLWIEAGFDTTFGSYYYPKSTDDGDDSSTESSLKVGGTINYDTLSSCMGSPCSLDVSWADECEVTCICPTYPDSDDDTGDDDGVCIFNTLAESVLPWQDSLSTLQSYITDLEEQFAKIEDDDSSYGCRECTVV